MRWLSGPDGSYNFPWITTVFVREYSVSIKQVVDRSDTACVTGSCGGPLASHIRGFEALLCLRNSTPKSTRKVKP